MAFPTIPTSGAGRVLTVNQANETSPRTFPSLSSLTKASGDLLIAIICVYQSSSGAGAPGGSVFSSWGGGFTEFCDQMTTASSTMAIGAAYKWSTGSETGTFTVAQAATITGHASMILIAIPGAHASTVPEAGTIVNGTTSAADPASFDPAGWAAEDTLWVSVACIGETSLTGSFTGMGSAPTNYSITQNTGISADVIGATAAGVAYRQLNSGSENVGAWSPDVGATRNSALLIAVRPVAGVAHTASPADTLSLNDALVITWDADRIPSEAVTAADSFARVAPAGRAVADSVALADARGLGQGQLLTDSITLADSATPSVGGAEAANPADTLSLSDAVAIAWGANRSGADGVALVDATIDSQGIRLGDTVALTDSATPSEAGAHTANPADSLSLADSLTRVVVYARSVTDGVTLADATKDAQGVRLGDTVTPADVLARVHTAARAVVDSVSLADQTFTDEGGGAALTASPSDSLSLSDALVITWTADRIPSEAVALADARAHARGKAVADSLTLADLATPDHETGTVDHEVNPADTVSLTWQVTTEFTRILDSATDTVTISDNFSRVAVYGRTQTDGLNLTDTTRDAQGIRLGDIAVIVDALARAVTAARTITDSAALADQLAQVVAKARTLTDSVTLADARTYSRARVQVDAVALADVLARTSVSLRSVADSVALLDNAVPAKAGSGAQPVNDLLSLSDTFARIATYTRAVADSVALADARTYARGKALTDSLALADAQALAQGQALTDSVVLTDQLARTATYLRSVADSIALADNVSTSFAGADSVQVNDLLALIDSLTRAYGRALVDTVALTDVLTSARGRAVTIADTVAVTDLFSRLAIYARTPADSISLADLFAAGASKPLSIADLVALADAQFIFNGVSISFGPFDRPAPRRPDLVTVGAGRFDRPNR